MISGAFNHLTDSGLDKDKAIGTISSILGIDKEFISNLLFNTHKDNRS